MLLILGAIGVGLHAQAPLATLDCPDHNQRGDDSADPERCALPEILALRTGRGALIGTGHFIHENGEPLIAVGTFGLVVVTGGLWLATWRLWKTTLLAVTDGEKAIAAASNAAIAANRQVSVMEDTAERQLRAYVLVYGAQVSHINEGDMATAKVTIRNFGQTPAYELRQWSNMGFDLFPPTIDPPMEDTDEPLPSHPLGPGGDLYAFPVLRRRLQKFEIDGLRKGEVAIYIIGKIRYKDAFGADRLTEYHLFCGGPIGIDGGKTAPTERGKIAT